MIKTLVKTLQGALSSFFHIKLFTVLRSKIHKKKNFFFFLKQMTDEMASTVYSPRPFGKGRSFAPRGIFPHLSSPPRSIRACGKFPWVLINNIHPTHTQRNCSDRRTRCSSPKEITKKYKQNKNENSPQMHPKPGCKLHPSEMLHKWPSKRKTRGGWKYFPQAPKTTSYLWSSGSVPEVYIWS